MKKFISVLMCFLMLLSLFSCSKYNAKDNEKTYTNNDSSTSSNTSNDTITNNTSVNYDSVLRVYRRIVDSYPIVNQNPRAVAAELGIQDEAEIEAFVDLYSSIHLFYPGSGQEDSVSPHHKLCCGYAIKDLNGDGTDELVLLNNEYYIMAVFSYADGKPVLLGNCWNRNSCWIDGDGLIHNNGSSGADYSTNAVYKIADGGESLELIAEFGTNGYEWIGDIAYTIYYKLVDGEKTIITETEYRDLDAKYGKYLGSVAGAEATKKHSGLTFISLYTEAEIAMEMYEAAINDEICVLDEHLGEIKLKACRFPSNNTRLDECKLLMKAILDMDQNGVNEYVIKSPNQEYIILRYYNGKVYSYLLDTCDFYNFNTDGSFHWYDSSEEDGWACGLNRIVFDGETLNIKSIYSIKFPQNSTKYEYFVEGEAATRSEYGAYRADNIRNEKMKFSYFELTCSYPITAEQAWNLANEYWDNQDGRTDVAAGTVYTARIVLIDTPNSDTNYYRFAFNVESTSNGAGEGDECRPPYHINSHDQILVNAFTGEITASTYKPDGKVLSVEEAIEIVKNKFFDEDIHNEEDGYRFEHDVNEQAPDHIYIIIIQEIVDNHSSFYTREWVDKYTGEIIFGYYMYGKG